MTGTDAFDVSPFHFYLKTRLRHKLLGLGTSCASGPHGAVIGGTTCPMGGRVRYLPLRGSLYRPHSVHSGEENPFPVHSGWKGGLEGCVCEGTGDTGRGGSPPSPCARLAPGRRCGNVEL